MQKLLIYSNRTHLRIYQERMTKAVPPRKTPRPTPVATVISSPIHTVINNLFIKLLLFIHLLEFFRMWHIRL